MIVNPSCKEQKETEEPVQLSGIYPHLAMYSQQGECGTGAVVPWAGKLWTLTYSPHFPFGSESNKLYSITSDLERTIRPESVGGTPANRMIHRESEQLFIGPYAIDDTGRVRVISYERMPGRPTGNARHLTDPENKIYYASMEEGLYEVNVNDLSVNTLYMDGNQLARIDSLENMDSPILPGYHGKGLYSGQGRVVYANNGEHSQLARERSDIESGCLAEWQDSTWNVVRRDQFTEVMGPGGIYGNDNPKEDPIWSIGWDHRSLILMVLDNNQWHSYRLPKASHCYDGAHGWNTEWPRIRDIGQEDLLMTMHGTFWRFPESFSAGNSAGIAPRSTYLKVIADFCRWNERIVMACDDAAQSVFQNTRKIKNEEADPGQSQSNLWFVEPGMLNDFGPPLGRGAVWLEDDLEAGEISEPYLFNGYNHRMIHLSHESDQKVTFRIEVDCNGTGNWELLQTLEVPPRGYQWHIFDKETRGQWIRISPRSRTQAATAWFHYRNKDRRDTHPDPVFDGLATEEDQDKSGGILWALGNNQRKLGINAARQADGQMKQMGYYELDSSLTLQKKNNPKMKSRVQEAAPKGNNIKIDEASIIIKGENSGQRYRLPKRSKDYSLDTTLGWPRIAREVVTERDLMNCGGTFYEVPSRMAGGIARIRPVSTHNLNIYDFASYRGMLVMSGVASNEQHSKNPHIITSQDGNTAVWAGTIDDLWKLGKPRGVGGPWNNTQVKAGEPSDPYLMTGYDKKEMELKHDAGETVTFRIEVDINGKGLWKTYDTFEVEPGESLEHDFPEGFSAYWVRLRSDHNCQATAILTYK
jgi:hypothetical protein